MKTISKKIMVLSLAGLMFGAAAGLTGCDDREKTVSGAAIYSTTSLSNAYIVVSENGVETLHKGDLIERAWGPSIVAMTPILEFNCGKELQTYQFVAYPQGCPAEDKYDEICDCARETTLQSKENDQNQSTKNTNLHLQQEEHFKN